MGYFLAIDAGGTRTECCLADDLHVLARVTGETVRLTGVGATRATARLRELLERASAVAGVPLTELTRTCMGMVEVAGEGARTWAEIVLPEMVRGELLLTSREEVALEAAFGEGPGALVFAETAAMVVGRCSNGARMASGGWGPVLGDEGSAYWIGMEAVRSSLRARDRGVPTCMLREVMRQWQVASVEALLVMANQPKPPDFAALVEVVAGCSGKGDVIATSVLEHAGEELAAKAIVVLSKMQAGGCAPGDVQRVAFTGDVLTKLPPVLRAMRQALARTRPEVVIQAEAVEPIAGALLRARRP